ncbi:MAG TPA: hypothetical protein VIG31_08525 [Rhodanobacteraceae bacterium]
MALIVPGGAAVVKSQAREGRSGAPKPRSLRPASMLGKFRLCSSSRNREAISGLRRQDAEANIGEADGPKGEPQEAASLPAPLHFIALRESHWVPAFAGMTSNGVDQMFLGRSGDQR